MLAFSPSARFVRKFLSRRGKILDLGCGGGKNFYAAAGPVTGIDLSLDSLFKARDRYEAVIQADALKLPFKDETFDYVVSQDLIGHIPVDRKEKLISEIYRVLKKEGLTIHYIETKGNNIIERIATRFPELYQKYFIEQDGHYGLELPTQAIGRFRSRGFKPVAEKKWASTFLRFPKEYLKRFDNEYVKESVFLALIVEISRFIRKTKILERPVEMLILISQWFFDKFSSFDRASGVYVCYEKKRWPFRLCFISGAYPPVNDGIGDYTARLMSSLRKQDLQTSLVTTDEGEAVGRIRSEEPNQVYSIVKKWDIAGVVSILKFIKKKIFGLVHIQFPSTRYQGTIALGMLPFFIRVFFRRFKVIVTLHEYSLSYPINRMRQFFLALFSQRVIVTDKGDFKEVSKILPWGKKKIEVIPVGSNIDVCEYDMKEREAFVKDLKLKPETNIISFFGVIHPNKGLETLLEAMRDLIRNDFPVHLVIISELDSSALSSLPKGSLNRPYHQRIKALAESPGIRDSIFWTGYLPPAEVSRYLSLSHICVLPFTDGITLRRGTLMAALSHGVPVISTRSDRYIPEELMDGENILLVPIGDAGKLREAIERLCHDRGLRRRLGEGGRRLSSKFSWERIARMHMEIYRGLERE